LNFFTVHILTFTVLFFSVNFCVGKQNVSSDTAKVNHFNSRYWEKAYSDVDSAYYYANEGLALSKEIGYLKGEHGMLLCLAHYNLGRKKIKKSLELKQEALKIAKRIDRFTEALTYLALGENADYGSNNRLLVYYLKQAYKISEELNREWLMAKSLAELAKIEKLNQNMDEAKKLYLQSYLIFDTIHNEISIVWPLRDLTQIYTMENNLDSALLMADKTLFFLKKSNNLKGQALILKDLGIIDRKQGRYDLALEKFEQSIAYWLQLDHKNFLDHLTVELEKAKVLTLKGDIQEAENLLSKILKNTEEDNKHFKFLLFEAFSELYKRKGDINKAYAYLERSIELELAYQKELNKTHISNLDLLYEVEMQKAENELLQQDIEITKKKNYLNIFLIAASFLLFMMAILIWSYVNRIRLNRKLIAQNQQISQQKLELQEINHLQEAQNEALKSLNSEKDNAIKIVTHDLTAPLNRIAGLINVLKVIIQQPNAEVENLYDKIDQVVEEGKDTVKRLLDIKELEEGNYALRGEEINLSEYFEALTMKFGSAAAKKNIQILLAPAVKDVVIKSEEFYLSRIFENLLSNAIKFSFVGGEIKIAWEKKQEMMEISVTDNGPGVKKEERHLLFQKFQRLSSRPTAGENSTGLGLAIVNGIVKKMNGAIRYKEAKGGGAKFIVEIPLQLKVHSFTKDKTEVE